MMRTVDMQQAFAAKLGLVAFSQRKVRELEERVQAVEALHVDLEELQSCLDGTPALGLSAAVAAAENGTSVIVLEKRSILGGNANIIEAITASESPVQIRDGFDVTNDYLFKKSMEYCRWDCNPRVVRALINKSGDTIRWLEEKGIKFNLHPIWPSMVPVNWHEVLGTGPAWLAGTGELTRVLAKNCEELGVKLLCDTGVKRILTGTGGKVTGVVAVTKDGKELVEVKSEVAPIDAKAKITGKNSGLAPAITALTATCSTVYDHFSWTGDGCISPTFSSGL